MAETDQDWHIDQLNADHDRSAFSCGHESLDDFLKKFAGQNQKTGVSKTYVATRPGDRAVCGYYSISAGAVQFNDIPDDVRKRLPKYPVPVAHLGRLAVDGGVNAETAPACLEAGCDVLAAASAIFAAPDYAEAIAVLRGRARVTTGND